jgi:ribA/ribD-fused uncharacterized protein
MSPQPPRTEKGEAIAGGHLYFFGYERNSETDPAKYLCFSNMYPCAFTDEQGHEYTCSEQCMMAFKAKLFGDQDAAKKIMDFKPPPDQHKPREYQKMGREIKGFDEDLWKAEREALMRRVLTLKFSAVGNEALRVRLLETAGLAIVEASAADSVWGIGISVSQAAGGHQWRGDNLLGQALVAVREQLLAASSTDVGRTDAVASSSWMDWVRCCSRRRR